MTRPRQILLLLGLVGLSAAATLAAPAASLAQNDSVAPVCSTSWGPAADWYGTYPYADTYSQILGQSQYVDPYYVARGTLRECASQMYQHSALTCTAPNVCTAPYAGFRPFPTTAVPNVIDAAGGDDQTITITMPAALQVLWGQCLPRVGLGTVQCPSDASNPAHSGTMLYRVREADGFFRGPWTATQTGQSPGFQLQKLGTPCDIHATSCTYTVKFTRDTTNLPAVRHDIQALLQFDDRMMDDSIETGAEIAVPIVVVQQGGGAQPGPGQQPSTGPATTGGGGSSAGASPTPAPAATPPRTATPARCVVPALTKVKLATARTRLANSRCTVGKVSFASSRTVRKGRVIRTDPQSGRRLAARAKVALVVSRGR